MIATVGTGLTLIERNCLGKRGITADTAVRLARSLKTLPQLWMRITDWILREAMQRQKTQKRISRNALR